MAVAATTRVLTHLTHPRCEVALELVDDHFPLLLVRWAGLIQPQHVLKMIRFFDENARIAAAEGTRLVHICDARDAALPCPLVRDMLIDWFSDRPRSDSAPALLSYVIAVDPLIRGVIASLKWATGRGDGIRVVPKLEEAVAGARQGLEEAGLDVPEILKLAG
ncbi:hypothetical protein ENSA5_41340 [Enhygromyxa salina]|uniref:Uncharacterized protein n=1 Tax=Enhygromyxa salina TaxID=215803 RepID=A0A2S9XMR5_9BACT|nr:hypothetical protein [Enhygromyxa salina]PRP94179.1 hypothetical protein ENSA5_41340 [Enhygromyxa salina]